MKLNLNDWLTSSSKYPERAKSLELTKEITDNATKLVEAVNSLFKELGIEDVVVSSGFRPSGINNLVKGAKASGHLRGLAIDLEDKDGTIDTLLEANPKLLRKYGLFLESPKATVGWCHVDMIARVDRPSRIFNP